MLAKLAFRNIKNSFKDYTIYFITLMLSVAIFYMFNSIESQKATLLLSDTKSQMLDALIQVINYLSYFIAFLMGFLVVYANNYLIKRRSKELGLYTLLGMNKRKISLVIILETLLVGLLSLFTGLILGIGLGQLFSIFTVKIFEAQVQDFQFVFSALALRNTLICFGVIFVIIMLFNAISISKAKIINLFSREKQNENLVIKKLRFSVLFTILAIIFLGLGYYCIYDNKLTAIDLEFLMAFVFTFFGTVFFYLAVSTALLVILKKTKWYYRRLNMFITKDINKNITSNTGTMIITSLLLAVTIVVLSTSFSLTRGINKIINGASPYDISFYDYDGISNYRNLEGIEIDEYFDEYFEMSLYKYDYSYTYLCGEENYYNKNLYFIKLSDYNKSLALQNKQAISLDNNEIYINTQYDSFSKKMKNRIGDSIELFDQTFVFQGYLQTNLTTNIGSDDGFYVVMNDAYLTGIPAAYLLNANYKAGIDDSIFLPLIEEDLDEDVYINGCSKEIVKDANTGTTAIITFIALYISIVFLITSAAVLSIQQLSKVQDNIESFKLLRKIGVDNTLMKKSIFVETLIYFSMPLILAIVHSIVGISVIHSIIVVEAPNLDIFGDTISTAAVFLSIYLVYFIITHFSSSRVITKSI